MPLTKSKGNMYPWVTHTHTHLGGKCAHECSYCYVQAIAKRFGHERYTGELRLVETEFSVNYGKDRVIFVEHCNDLFANAVPDAWILRILEHCRAYPDNTYVFQTKNPDKMLRYLNVMPVNRLLGCTLETNEPDVILKVSPTAPLPFSRCEAMKQLSDVGEKTFFTVEPILSCRGWNLAHGIANANPAFVNIGADSKGIGLPEPKKCEILALIAWLEEYQIEIRQKSNLQRLLEAK